VAVLVVGKVLTTAVLLPERHRPTAEETVELVVTTTPVHRQTPVVLEETHQVLEVVEVVAEDPAQLKVTVRLVEELVDLVQTDRLYFTYCSNANLSPQRILRRREELSIEYKLREGD
jgi:predicted HAD superfamily Cof-like phosphohydrolase